MLGYDEGAEDLIRSEEDCETLLLNVLLGQDIRDLVPDPQVCTFANADLLTRDRGLLIRFANGVEFQLTIKKSA